MPNKFRTNRKPINPRHISVLPGSSTSQLLLVLLRSVYGVKTPIYIIRIKYLFRKNPYDARLFDLAPDLLFHVSHPLLLLRVASFYTIRITD